MSGFLAAKTKAIARARPLNVQLELTYVCPLRCAFCYNPRHHDLRRLTAREWTTVLDGLRDLGTMSVALTGGEPLTHPEFFQIAQAVRGHEMGLKIFTGATLVGREEARRIKEFEPLSVEVSLHGANAATHDAVTGKYGSFVAMMEGLEALLAEGVRLLLKTPVCRLNENEIDEMIALSELLKLPYVLDVNLTPRDDGDSAPLSYRATPEGVRRVQARLAEKGLLQNGVRQRGYTNCGLGTVTMAISPEGDVFPCIQWRVSALGNVRKSPITEIWRGSSERVTVAAIAREANDRVIDVAGEASSVQFCPALAQQLTGDPLNVKTFLPDGVEGLPWAAAS